LEAGAVSALEVVLAAVLVFDYLPFVVAAEIVVAVVAAVVVVVASASLALQQSEVEEEGEVEKWIRLPRCSH
jgi:uncharacterized protein YhhL (DUF1145 family)